MLALQGVGVLVTRPEQQAMPLCRLLESSGAVAVRLSAIDVKPVRDAPVLDRLRGTLEAFDVMVFTSANAVRYGMALLDQRPVPTLAAIGPATARALDAAGFRGSVSPIEGFDSERLLQHPAFAQAEGLRVLIVKGMRGRELLQDELGRRGALVRVAEVYERERARHGAAELEALARRFAAGEIQVITATSAEIATSLLDLATPCLRREFEHAHWVVASARVAVALQERGVPAPILQANGALDQDLVAAILRWRSVSGA